MIGRFVEELSALNAEGGPVFWFLVALGFGIAFALFSIWHFLREAKVELAKIGELPKSEPAGIESVEGRLREQEKRVFSALGRRIPFAFVLIGAAPLVGLLGTVTGMFATFDGLAGVSATAPVDVISKGVSEALITTQTGLIISVPAYILCSILKGKYEQLRNVFARMESEILQGCY